MFHFFYLANFHGKAQEKYRQPGKGLIKKLGGGFWT